MKFDYDLVVIGAGSGGLVVASGSASLGAKVVLIENEKMGGDCLNSGCVPSKSFLKGAHLAKDLKGAGLFGLYLQLNDVHIEKLMGRVQDVISSIEPHDSVERYEGLGVEVILGRGELLNPNHVGHTEITTKKFDLFKRSIFVPLGEKAGKMIPVATFVIHQKLKVSAFLDLIFSYPTEAEIFKTEVPMELKDSVKPWQSKIIKSLFLRHL